MDTKRLNDIINDPSVQAEVSAQELDTWIDAYPYLYQLHAIKARKTGASADTDHLLTITGTGWVDLDYDQHEYVSLEELAQQVAAEHETTSDIEEPTLDHLAALSPEVVAREVIADELADDVAVGVLATDDHIDTARGDQETLVDEDSTIEQDQVISHAAVATERSIEDEPEVPVVIEVEPIEVDPVIDDVAAFMGEDYEAPAEDAYKIALPDIVESSLHIAAADIAALQDNDQVFIKSKSGSKKKAKKSDTDGSSTATDRQESALDSEGEPKKKKRTKGEGKKAKKKDKSKKQDGKDQKRKSKKSTSKKAVAEKVKGKKDRDKTGKKKGRKEAGQMTPVISYKDWLLAQQQISKAPDKKKSKKKKKKSKVVVEAMKSVKKKSGIISEPLAELLVAQGHTNQAIAMYQELSLNYPKKSSYFAGRIEELINNK